MSLRNVFNLFRLLACILLLGLASCATNTRAPQLSPAQQFSNYQFDPVSPLADRIVAAPSFVVDYLNKYDKVDYYRNYTPTEQELSLAQTYLSSLPEKYQTILKSRLLGIYFIQDFVGSALTEFVYDKSNNMYAFIAVNAATLSTTMSDWLTLRDESCFKKADSSNIKLFSDCGESYMGSMYAILHESSHVVDIVLNYGPDSNVNYEKALPFIRMSWEGFSRTSPRFDFQQRKDLAFYGLSGGAKLPIKDALQAYRELARTPYTSLYASQNILEDFAELFTWTYYTRALHQRYSTTVIQNGEAVFIYTPMDNALVKERSLSLISWYD